VDRLSNFDHSGLNEGSLIDCYPELKSRVSAVSGHAVEVNES